MRHLLSCPLKDYLSSSLEKTPWCYNWIGIVSLGGVRFRYWVFALMNFHLSLVFVYLHLCISICLLYLCLSLPQEVGEEVVDIWLNYPLTAVMATSQDEEIFGQIHFAVWTNTLCSLDKCTLQVGQIHLTIWTNIFYNLDKSI